MTTRICVTLALCCLSTRSAALRLPAAHAATVHSHFLTNRPSMAMPASLSQPRLHAISQTAVHVALSLCLPALACASTASAKHLHLGQKVALLFQKTGLPDWAVLAIISATPAIELRGGIPVGNWMGLTPAATFCICVIGNMLPILPTLLALRTPSVKSLAAPLLKRAEKKLAALPKGQSRAFALALFVGVPFPGTGAWTGALIAYLLDMPLTAAMSSILAGVVLAGAIMTILTLAGRVGALMALGVLLLAGAQLIMSAAQSETASKEPPDESAV